jgi:hypothetical protein
MYSCSKLMPVYKTSYQVTALSSYIHTHLQNVCLCTKLNNKAQIFVHTHVRNLYTKVQARNRPLLDSYIPSSPALQEFLRLSTNGGTKLESFRCYDFMSNSKMSKDKMSNDKMSNDKMSKDKMSKK